MLKWSKLANKVLKKLLEEVILKKLLVLLASDKVRNIFQKNLPWKRTNSKTM